MCVDVCTGRESACVFSFCVCVCMCVRAYVWYSVCAICRCICVVYVCFVLNLRVVVPYGRTDGHRGLSKLLLHGTHKLETLPNCFCFFLFPMNLHGSLCFREELVLVTNDPIFANPIETSAFGSENFHDFDFRRKTMVLWRMAFEILF